MPEPHLKIKKGSIAPYVFLPGDPGRIKKIIKYWERSKKVAENREFLTYTGEYKGIPISCTSTGIGCPSAAIACEELANCGAKVFIRIGTCGGLRSDIKNGDLIIPYAATRSEGTTKEYIDQDFPAIADFEVVKTLETAAKNLKVKYFIGVNRTHDAFYEHIDNILKWANIYNDRRMEKWPYPLISSEMECSTIFLIAALRGIRAGAVLAVNTEEPLDLIAKKSKEIYKLSFSKKVDLGVENAIKTALGAIELLAK